MQIEIEGEADIGGGNKPKLTILLNKVEITSWSRGSSADDLVTEDIEFKAFYNTTDEQASKMTLVNLTSSYEVGS